MEQNGWEFVHRSDLPPLPEMHLGSLDGAPTWDRERRVLHPCRTDRTDRGPLMVRTHGMDTCQ